MPVVIINQHTVDNDLFRQGMTDEQVWIVYQSDSYIVRQFFETRPTEVFVLEVERRYASLGSVGLSYLIMDSRSAHSTDCAEELIAEH